MHRICHITVIIERSHTVNDAYLAPGFESSGDIVELPSIHHSKYAGYGACTEFTTYSIIDPARTTAALTI